MTSVPDTPDATASPTDPAALVEQYTPLARALALRRAVSAGVPWLADDMLSDALFGLWRASVRWEEAKAESSSFATFARWGIVWRLRQRILVERRRNPTAFTSQTERDGDGNEVLRIDLAADRRFPDPADAAELADDLAQLPDLLGELSEDRRALVVRYFSDDPETTDDIAADLGTSASVVRGYVSASLAKLRAAVGTN